MATWFRKAWDGRLAGGRRFESGFSGQFVYELLTINRPLTPGRPAGALPQLLRCGEVVPLGYLAAGWSLCDDPHPGHVETAP